MKTKRNQAPSQAEVVKWLESAKLGGRPQAKSPIKGAQRGRQKPNPTRKIYTPQLESRLRLLSESAKREVLGSIQR